MSRIDKIINYYKNAVVDKVSSGLELEIRFKRTSRDSFVSAYQNALKDKELVFDKIDQSVSSIVNNIPGGKIDKFAKYIRKQTFEKGKKMSDIYYKKKDIFEPYYVKGYLDYSINLSSENIITQFKSPLEAKIKLKSRASFKYNKWSFDFTLVKFSTLGVIGESLVRVKDLMFKYDLKENFLNVDDNIITDYSIEIEYIGDKKEDGNFFYIS